MIPLIVLLILGLIGSAFLLGFLTGDFNVFQDILLNPDFMYFCIILMVIYGISRLFTK